MPILNIYIDAITLARLEQAAERECRQVDELASCAIQEAALEYAKRHETHLPSVVRPLLMLFVLFPALLLGGRLLP